MVTTRNMRLRCSGLPVVWSYTGRLVAPSLGLALGNLSDGDSKQQLLAHQSLQPSCVMLIPCIEHNCSIPVALSRRNDSSDFIYHQPASTLSDIPESAKHGLCILCLHDDIRHQHPLRSDTLFRAASVGALGFPIASSVSSQLSGISVRPAPALLVLARLRTMV